MSDLHDRITRALGWSSIDVRALSLQELRELVRPVDLSLAQEIDLAIQSSEYNRGPTPPPSPPPPRPRSSRAKPAEKIAKNIEAALHAAQLYLSGRTPISPQSSDHGARDVQWLMATIGIDLASVDGNGTPDWDKSQTDGHLRFVGLRAVEGMTPDTWYPTYRRQLDAIGLPNFPYLIMTPNLDTPEAQAQKALDVVGTLNDHYFPLAIDVEGSRRGLSAAEWLDWVVRAKSVIKGALGVPPLLYSGRTYWSDPDGMNNLPAPELADCTPWWKYYPWPTRSPAVYDPTVVDKLVPPPAPLPWGDSWIIQQYAGDALGYPGFRLTVDTDRLHVQRLGDANDSVRWVQRRLPGLVVDGIFGPKTAEAVRAFQIAKKIGTDGIVGLDTAQLLAWVPPRSA